MSTSLGSVSMVRKDLHLILREQQDALSQWNSTYPDGTHVIWATDMGRTQTQTRGLALLINGRAYVYLRGVHGAKPLSEVKPCFCRWVKLNRRNRINHWVFGAWENEDAMQRDIDAQIAKDASIESHEISNLRPQGAT
jgi:hypothetical protein